jgi:hypothetical protein
MLIEIEAFSNADGQILMYIDCYSYQRSEFISVYKVLENSRVEYSESSLARDKNERLGLRYSLIGRNIEKLETYLKIKFFSDEINGEGDAYKCKRICALNNETGCKTIHANDKDSANMICAIVAKKNKWFGGVAEKGKCNRFWGF